MAGRAAKRNIGGGTWYSGGNSNVASEAKERKDGGGVAKKKAGGAVAKRAYGGRSVGKPEGRLTGGRLDKRARGGGIRKLATGGGADKNPFSSAGAGGDRGRKTTIHGTSLSGRATGGAVKKK